MADFDAIVIGAGCAGCVAAYELARADKNVLVVERGGHAGAKNMTGGRIYSHSLKKVFPNFEEEAPLERKITHEKLSFITEQSNFTIDFTSPQLGHEGQDSYSVLRGPFDQWLAEQAERAGAEFVYGISVDDLITSDGAICGVIAGEDQITADITILADGANSLLSVKSGLATVPKPHQMAVGAKEIIEIPSGIIADRFNCADNEGAAWLFVGDATHGHVGGGFLYTNKDSVSLGLVATLSELSASTVPIYQMLEDFKKHPAIAPLIKGGVTAEYSGHLIPEGGYNMIPTLYKDGCLLTGDAAMLCINLGYQVRGMDFAVFAGQVAAKTALQALEAGDYSAAMLKSYAQRLNDSFVLKDLQQFKRFPHFMESTTRLFTEYPQMLQDMMLSMFVVDGTPVLPLKKKLMKPVKKVGLLNILKDARGGVRAL